MELRSAGGHSLGPVAWAMFLSLLVWALVGLAAWGFWELLLG
jgi:hypothetical protein